MNCTPGEPKDPHLSELVRGASLAFANAEELFREAQTLSACKAFSRALFLHQISLEECGKTEIIGWWATGHLMGISVDVSRIRSRLARHKVKNFANAYMLPLNEAQQKARDESDWRREHQAFKKQQAEFHQQSNEKKNASLYVDFVDDVFLAPDDRITEDMVHEIAETNHTFIELMRPKVEMLTFWEQYPDVTRDVIKGFQERMQALWEEYPDDPREALEVLDGEMMEQLKKARQKDSGD